MNVEEIDPGIYFVFTCASKELCIKELNGDITFIRTLAYKEMIVKKEQYYLLRDKEIQIVHNIIEV